MRKKEQFYDKIYRYLFKMPKFIKALVKFAFSEQLYEQIDWNTVKGEKTHFVSKSLKSREADAIYEVQLKNKEKIYIYFLVEFQSSVDKRMALRLYIYIAMFYNELLSKNRIGKEVPIVLPIVLYTGDKKWTSATKLSNLMNTEVYKIVKQYVPELQYMLIDKNRYSESDLKTMQDSISGILYVEKLEEEQIKENLGEFFQIFMKGLDLDEQEVLVEYVKLLMNHKFTVTFKDEDLKTKEAPKMLATAISKWEEKILQEGRVEGRVEGLLSTAVRMLEKKFPIDIISEVTGLSEDEIKKLQQKKKV